jgi:hypothetical protein
VKLIEASRDLPFLYGASYIDGNFMYFHLLEWPDDKTRLICGDPFSIAFYPSLFCEDILTQIKSDRRCKFYRENQENRWYLERIKDAIESALWLQAPFLVVSISQCLGPTRYDEEIKAALKSHVSRWLPGQDRIG